MEQQQPAETAVPTTAPRRASGVVLPWLVRLRWASVAALAVTAGLASAWGVRLPLASIGMLLAGLAATNVVLAFQLRSADPSRTVIGAVLLLDAALLTGILYFAGGPMNPFSTVYLIGVTLAAVMLGPRWALSIAAASVSAYLLTFFWSQPLRFTHDGSMEHELTLHLSGMWVALAAAALLIAYFVGRVSEALEQREAELLATRTAVARTERLAALLSLGAGAAHELATPLSSIRIAAAELERVFSRPGGTTGAGASDFLGVIRRETDRCAQVLDQLSGRATSASADDSTVEPVRLVEDIRRRLGDARASRLDVELPAAPRAIAAPIEPLRQTLVALLQNAFDASGQTQRVTLRLDQDSHARLEVIDHGCGMSSAVLDHIGEPFLTTKAPGSGLGLGLFLARAFAEQMGGALHVSSVAGAGTTVSLDLPPR